MKTESELLKECTKSEKAKLRKLCCGWCDKPLNNAGCGAIYEPCSPELRAKRLEAARLSFKNQQLIK